MAQRYKVVRMWVKHKGIVYRAGDLLPEDFTHHDRFRTVYPSRIGLVEVPDAEITPIVPVITPETPETAKDTPTGDTEPPIESSDDASKIEAPVSDTTPETPDSSEKEDSETPVNESSDEEPKEDEGKVDSGEDAKIEEVKEPEVLIQAVQPPKAKPITPVSGKALTGSKPARSVPNKPTGAPTGARRP